MNELNPIEVRGQRILTTEQLAEFYGTTADRIKQNFNRNEDKFARDKHFYLLEGNELKAFKSQVSNCDLPISKYASQLYLWTERGASRHAKMLGTDQAWDVFDQLEESYFNPQLQLPQTPEEKLALTMQVATRTVQKVENLDLRVTDIEENTPIAPGEYNYIARQVNKAVHNWLAAHEMKLTNKQRAPFYKDINRGLNEYLGIKTRTQLRRKDFDRADEFIENWSPSTAVALEAKSVQQELVDKEG